MTISTVSSQRTYALVVGIEKYNAGTNWNLNGPANDARKFAEWLCSRGVPRENIFLFLSPLDNNSKLAAQPEPEVQAATQYNISRTITDILPQKEGELLYIFWGGHGMITAEGERRLFYADTTQKNKRNLDLQSLLISLRSEYFRSFPRQICIIDACANYIADPRLPIVAGETFSGGPPRKGCEQFVLLAAKTGEVAKNVTTRQTGLFSEAVMKELAKEAGSSGPPNMEDLTNNLKNLFKRLRQEGSAQQTPTYLWYRDWDDREDSLGRIEEVEPMPSENSPRSGVCIEVFLCYSDEDEKLRKQLEETCLSSWEGEGIIKVWHKGMIRGGQNPKQEIHKHLESSRVFLLLISPNFMTSYHRKLQDINTQVERLMQRQEAKQAEVIPILIESYANWKRALRFGELKHLPKNGKFVNDRSWKSKNEAFGKIAEQFEEVIHEIIANSP